MRLIQYKVFIKHKENKIQKDENFDVDLRFVLIGELRLSKSVVLFRDIANLAK